ncbi:MAG TPA: ABC transporter substrate-binding protein, partial [Anaerolineales bacterium]|nr:ABC transporter substrate-binding protein [Anaerolineales bacterium]
MKSILQKYLWGLFACVLLLTGCNFPTRANPPLASIAPDSTAAPDSAATPTLTPSPIPPRTLSICMGGEPQSLFIYADDSVAARSVRQAIYDGPFDISNYTAVPVILESIPSITNGGAAIQAVSVNPGEAIIDSVGNPTTLTEGIVYRPAGCTQANCSVSYSGQEAVLMDQLVVQFRLLPNLQWADGAPLTADDSLFAYEIAQALFPRVRSELLVQTASYQAVDTQTVAWRGLPGGRLPSYATNFFAPLPRHAWGSLQLETLFSSEEVNRRPLGWGPYVVDEWIAGDHITLSKNPAYFRAAEGLPAFDHLVFRFMPDGAEALSALLAGECDYVDETAALETQREAVAQAAAGGSILMFEEIGTAWEQATINLAPAPQIGADGVEIAGRPALLAARETRQALLMCLDRSALLQELGLSSEQVAHTYVAPGHPLYNDQARTYAYDPQAAAGLLQAAGWVDGDGRPETPRVAQGAAGVPDGTPLSFSYYFSDEPEKQIIAQFLQAAWSACGAQLNLQPLPWNQLMAPGPDGPVFGRQFDMAQFAWISGRQPPCDLYTTREIPGDYPQHPKGWGGANAGAFQDSAFETACLQALNSLPDE